jgi:citrate synthase
MRDELKTDLPTNEQIAAYVKKTLSEGKVVPGMVTQYFAKQIRALRRKWSLQKNTFPDDPLVKTVWNIYETVPPILQSTGKNKKPMAECRCT